jgi:uncharacterized membrane protein
MAEEEIISTRRLEALTDGIFAFSMTLLVIFIETPKAHHLNDPSGLQHYLSQQYPQFISYLITFLLLANFWVIHHQISRHITKTNYLNLWLNIVFMLFIVLLPFSSVIVGDYPKTWGGIFLFMINLLLISILLLAVWVNASINKRLINPEMEPKRIEFITNELVIGSFFCLLSIFISFIYLPMALYIYLLIPIFVALYDINYRKKIIKI